MQDSNQTSPTNHEDDKAPVQAANKTKFRNKILIIGALVITALMIVVAVIIVTTQKDKSTDNTVVTSNTEAEVDKTNPFEHELPLGDGKVSNSPQKGYVYACQTEFRGGGAEHIGSWVNGSSWDPTKKIAVQGEVKWPNAKFTITNKDGKLVISGNDLPTEQTTGIFPISNSDPAYQYDRNPNSILAQNIVFELTSTPELASSPSCTSGGSIGIMTNGVLLFNGLDAAGRDAVAHEVQDSCDGHPQQSGQYHYHSLSKCLIETSSEQVIGYALDGFGITGPKQTDGSYLGTNELDECHGTTSEIIWNGERKSIYHYVMTADYPYSIGCFKGNPISTNLR